MDYESSYMRATSQSGFTLVELIVTLAVLSVLASLAAPSFSGALKNARLTDKYNDLVGTMQLARSEAVKGSTNVVVCARETDTECGLDWGQGWLAFIDDGATPDSYDAGEQIIRLREPLTGGAIVGALGSSINGGAFLVRTNIRFGPRGTSSWRGGGAVKFCDDRGDDELRGMFVSISGDIRRARKNVDGLILTPWGAQLTC